MFAKDVILEITKAAQSLDIEPAALLAVAEVESGGTAFADVNGRREPLIRFEAHFFDRRLSDRKRAVAREKGLAAPVAGAIANPRTQAARWRMLEQAASIDAKAAYESVSWGLGQVMGAHWAWLGYADVDALVAAARSGVAGQVRIMMQYIDKAGLRDALRKHDWAGFARSYNGPAYKRNAYDAKLAAAYARYAPGNSGARPAMPLLKRGSRGTSVADLQHDLTALGYPIAADGVFGPATVQAVMVFQRDHALTVDGIVGARTNAAIGDALTAPGPVGKSWKRLKDWLAGLLRRS
jgi:murein L,D-transpeptidase YcbB/YkuD